MKSLLIVFLSLITGFAEELNNNNIIYNAARAELKRSITKLQIEHQKPPYYLAYRIVKTEKIESAAQFGGLLYNTEETKRGVYVELRVGSYDFDNSNFVCPIQTSQLIESDYTDLPLEDNYYAIRNALWLVTDGTYKKALEKLSRKKATLQNQPQYEPVPDFSPAPACTINQAEVELNIDKDIWAEKIRRLSEIFKSYPAIKSSEIKFSVLNNTQLFLDSEHNHNQRTSLISRIEISAQAQAKNGDPIKFRRGFYTTSPEDLPDFEQLQNKVRAFAETLSIQAGLQKEEDYSGPVLFLGAAATQLFFNILGKGVSNPRSLVYENEMLKKRSSSKEFGQLVKRLGHRVMSKLLSAFDDPTISQYENTPLIGHFLVDDEGVCAQRVELVKDGKLVSLLMNRSPIKKIRRSNGHARYYTSSSGDRIGAMTGNLFINAHKTKTYEELIDLLINLCKDYEIPYGIIITRLEANEPQTLKDRYLRYFRVMRGLSSEFKPLPDPLIAYKIDVSSRKIELIRGLDFSEVTPRILRDIIAAGKDSYIDNFIYYDQEGNQYPVSVIAPAVLIEEMDLIPKELKPEKLPILPHPYFKK